MGEAETAAITVWQVAAIDLAMSNQQEGNYADREPLNKRQKRGDGDEKEVDETIAFGEPMYDEATARKMLEEVVIQAGTNGEAPFIGFDPNDAALDNVYRVGELYVTPIIHFVLLGDLEMCRYLASRGASTTKTPCFWRPMHAAAKEGHLEVCKFLFVNGASHHIWKELSYGWTPFRVAASNEHDEVVRWLVLHGALCADANSEEIERGRIYPTESRPSSGRICMSSSMSSSCERLVEWAKEVTESHSSLMMFLLGAATRSRQRPKPHPSVLERSSRSAKAHWQLCWTGSQKREAPSYLAECGGCVALLD